MVLEKNQFVVYIDTESRNWIDQTYDAQTGQNAGVFSWDETLRVQDDSKTKKKDESRWRCTVDMSADEYTNFARTFSADYFGGSDLLIYGNSDLYDLAAITKGDAIFLRVAIYQNQTERIHEILGCADVADLNDGKARLCLSQEPVVDREDMPVYSLFRITGTDFSEEASKLLAFAGEVEAVYPDSIRSRPELEKAIGLDLANFYYTVAAPAVNKGIEWFGSEGLSKAQQRGATLKGVLGCSAEADTAVDVMVRRFWQATRLWTSEEDLNNLALDLYALAARLAPAERMQDAYYKVVLEVFGQKVKAQCDWDDNWWYGLDLEKMTGTDVVKRILNDEADGVDERLAFQEIWSIEEEVVKAHASAEESAPAAEAPPAVEPEPESAVILPETPPLQEPSEQQTVSHPSIDDLVTLFINASIRYTWGTDEEALKKVATDLKDVAVRYNPEQSQQYEYYKEILNIFGQKIKEQTGDRTARTGTEVVWGILKSESDDGDDFIDVWKNNVVTLNELTQDEQSTFNRELDANDQRDVRLVEYLNKPENAALKKALAKYFVSKSLEDEVVAIKAIKAAFVNKPADLIYFADQLVSSTGDGIFKYDNSPGCVSPSQAIDTLLEWDNDKMKWSNVIKHSEVIPVPFEPGETDKDFSFTIPLPTGIHVADNPFGLYRQISVQVIGWPGGSYSHELTEQQLTIVVDGKDVSVTSRPENVRVLFLGTDGQRHEVTVQPASQTAAEPAVPAAPAVDQKIDVHGLE